jgi:hypothetical protein
MGRPPERPEPFSPPSRERSKGPDTATFVFAWRAPADTGTYISNLTNPHPVARLTALVALRADLDAAIDAAVEEARGMRPKPATWREIGQAVGRTKTAAQARWGRTKQRRSEGAADDEHAGGGR